MASKAMVWLPYAKAKRAYSEMPQKFCYFENLD
jgi:hypothetical protein